uniref:Protein phosphatase 1 regulatory subunit n=2 Tax=Anopheles triannulatus TaxID=58253 RepID=A0A2M4AVH5_9DIPT
MRFLVIALVALSSIETALSVKCSIESINYAPGNAEEFCVLKGLKTDGAATGDIQTDPSITRVAIVDSSLKRLTAAFYERFPRLEHLVVRNSGLEQLHITNIVRIIDAPGNQIKSISIQGGGALQELNLHSNSISDITPISGLVGLTKLNLGATSIANDNSFDFTDLGRLTNLTELYIDGLDLYYLENTNKRVLPNLRVLDLSHNPLTPSNFQLDLFRAMPKLEVLLLRNCLLTSLSVYPDELRTDFPSLEKIYLEGNHLKCPRFTQLLDILKANGIDPVEPEQAEECSQGFMSISQMCCQFLMLPPTETTTTSSTTTVHPSSTTQEPKQLSNWQKFKNWFG